MATKVLMEALSPTMEEGRLVEWKKNEGDAVAQGDVLAEVETDKAVMELVARAAGTLIKVDVKAGSTVQVGTVLALIGEKGEATGGREDGTAGSAAAAAPAPTAPPPSPKPTAPPAAAPTPAPAPPSAPPATSRVKASPLARKLAGEKGVDIASITGTGPEGRVVKKDVEGAQPVVPSSRPSAVPSSRLPAGVEFEDIPLTQIRKTIAKRLVQSIGPIPTFYLTTEVDMERAAEAREALKASLGDEGKVSFNDIVLKAVATALSQHPECNAWWQDDHIRKWNTVHLGMAVAIPEGLITPVIRNAETKSMRQIAAEARDMAGRARERKLKPEE